MHSLRKLGHEPILISRRGKQFPRWRVLPALCKRLVMKYVIRRPNVDVSAGIFDGKERARIERHARRFIAEHVQPQTAIFQNTKQLVRDIPRYNFDAIIVGSDQVWRPKYAPNIEENFLNFLSSNDGIRRISYAASFGTDGWEFTANEQAACGALVAEFDALSVREAAGVEMCRAHFSKDAVHVVDPTMLLEATDYIELAGKSADPQPEKTALIYLLDEDDERREVVSHVATLLDLVPTRANAIGPDGSSLPVEKWLKGFSDADFVITDSFHACVFAILFHKPFLAYGNLKRGLARFESLLNMFNLSDRLVSSPSDVTDELVQRPIDWINVDALVSEQRAKGKAFLISALVKHNDRREGIP
ncbi:polysaccharide pyruvyl transferase family protein [Stenotrophomonas sp. CFBP 13718]|nr:polysaccharide pyruvyl transferase family protein [Stenotrophomonas sp. CFBP 13718]